MIECDSRVQGWGMVYDPTNVTFFVHTPSQLR